MPQATPASSRLDSRAGTGTAAAMAAPGHVHIALRDRAGWNEALRDLPHAFAHTWGSCHAMSLTTGYDTFLYRFEYDGVRIACPFATRSFRGYADIVTPYGFSGFAAHTIPMGFAGEWEAHARAAGFVCGYVQLHPVLDQRRYREADVVTYNTAFVLDLDDDEASLFRRLSTNRQRQIRAAPRNGTRFVYDVTELEEFYWAALPGFLAERRAANNYYLSRDTVSALFSLDNVLAVGAAVAGRLEAVAIFGYTRFAGDWLFHVSRPGARHHTAPLIWEGMLRLRERGVPVLNLGGGVRGDDGVASFKRRFGGRECALRSLRQVYRPDIYRTLCDGAGVSPHTRTGYFPPYHSP